jgi:hypothetical protein
MALGNRELVALLETNDLIGYQTISMVGHLKMKSEMCIELCTGFPNLISEVPLRCGDWSPDIKRNSSFFFVPNAERSVR